MNFSGQYSTSGSYSLCNCFGDLHFIHMKEIFQLFFFVIMILSLARFTACWRHIVRLTSIIYFNLRSLLCSFSLLLLGDFLNLLLTLLNASPQSHLLSAVIITHLLILFYSLHLHPILISCLRAFELVHHFIISLWSPHWKLKFLMCISFVEYMSRSHRFAVTLWKIHWLVSFINWPFLLFSWMDISFWGPASPFNLWYFNLILLF